MRFLRLILLLLTVSLAMPPTRSAAAESTDRLQMRLETLERQQAELLERLNTAELPPEPEEPETDDLTDQYYWSPLLMYASWEHGLEARTLDGKNRLHVGGRIQFDGAWFDAGQQVQFGPGGTGLITDGVSFRRARLRADGLMSGIYEWAVEFDFVNAVQVREGLSYEGNTANIPAPTDLWFTFTRVPVLGNVRLGNMKEPIGFEHLISSRYLEFMERSFNQDAFTGRFNNGFSPGVMAFNWTENERMTWAIGGFRAPNNPFAFSIGGGEYVVTGRLTALPVYERDGRQLIHVGISASHRDADNNEIRVRARPSLRAGPGPLNPLLADTGVLTARNEDMIGAELVLQNGPFSVQSEYMLDFIHETDLPGGGRGTIFVQGGYVEVLCFLTGEHRAYNRRAAVFDRIVPHETFSPDLSGIGGWQVGVRYAYLNLNDGPIRGGILHDITAGLNWFLNANAKLQWNYIYTRREAGNPASSGDIHGLGMRLAWDF